MVQPVTPWFVRIGERSHPLLLPLVVFLVLYVPFLLLEREASLFFGYGMSKRQMIGTSLLFSLIPGYVLFAQFHAWQTARRTVNEFAAAIPAHAADHARAAVSRPGGWMVVVVILGAISGSQDFSKLDWLANLRHEIGFDLWFRFTATVCWGFLFWLLAWRVRCSRAMYHLGESLTIDVYKLDGLNRFVRLPLVHLLIVIGAAVLMPLQSLDFEVRWVNYRSGVYVGLPALLLLVVPPIWGLHRNMRDRISERIAALQVQVDDCDRSDLSRLALLIEHRETVRDFPSWPLDVGLVGKLLFYLIIPPLAWIAAALVERAVDTLL